MRGSMLGGLAALAAMALAGAAWAQPAPSPAKNDYSKGEAWLCLPGRQDACAADLDATVVKADGTLTPAPGPKAAADAKVDCFYVYPTVSTDKTGNSDMVADAPERAVVAAQFARFRGVCRTFAPMYRQITLTALMGFLSGKPIPADRELAYADVRDAWNWYLAHENKGRGVILIGHSQGTGVLARLIKEEIDGKPAQKLMVSAMLIGGSIPQTGGKAGTIPLCTAESQTGCIISYVSFRSTVPPAPTSRFGKVAEEGASAVCTNPAALGGGKGDLSGDLPTRYVAAGSEWARGKVVNTPFVQAPGLLTAECVNADGFSYLKVQVNADPADPRVDDINGGAVGAMLDPNWGLHNVDVMMAMEDLVRIAAAQGKAWTK